MSLERFEGMYVDKTPWEIGRPQAEFERLARAGQITGSVLDSGCGTGENSLLLASLGFDVVAVDFSPTAIARAKQKAAERKLRVDFRVLDALQLSRLERQFDTVIDSGVFHIFGDADRATYVQQLAAVVVPGGKLFIVCFSENEPGEHGPRRVTTNEIQAAFADGWTITSIEPARYELVNHPGGMQFTPGGAIAWRASFVRHPVA